MKIATKVFTTMFCAFALLLSLATLTGFGFGQDQKKEHKLVSSDLRIPAVTKAFMAANKIHSNGKTFGGGTITTPMFTMPVLKLNRRDFTQGQTLQAWVVLPNSGTDYIRAARFSWLLIPPDGNNYVSGYVKGPRLLIPGGEDVEIVNSYTFSSSQSWGEYILIVFCYEEGTGTLVAMPIATLTCGGPTSYVGIDAAVVTTTRNRRELTLCGSFIPTFGGSLLQQYVEIGGTLLPVAWSDGDQAIVDITNLGFPLGHQDITYVVWYPGNTAYDSASAPGVLTIR